MMAAAAGSALLLSSWEDFDGDVRLAGIGAISWMIHPLVLAVVVGAALVMRRGVDRPEPASGLLLLADQVALGLRAGLTLDGAMDEAVSDLRGPLTREVTGVLRDGRRIGMGAALTRATGEGSRLYRISDRAVRTGAPLGPAVEALADELRHEDHARRTAAARRLPVRLLIPLALLILPGFVLALVGPALVTSLARLDIGW